jgi:phosphatidylglycerol:prolipoprotein diacylglycerol transferase
VVNPRKRYDGQVFVWFVGLYAVLRFALEFLRRDARGGWVGLSTSQLIGVGLVAFALLLHAKRRHAAAPPADEPPAGEDPSDPDAESSPAE